jgi:hypothetical protein
VSVVGPRGGFRQVGGAPSTHPHLVALVRAGARFERGKLVEREVLTLTEVAA